MDWSETEVEIEQALMVVGIERYLAIQRLIALTNQQTAAIRNLAVAAGDCVAALQSFATAFVRVTAPDN